MTRPLLFCFYFILLLFFVHLLGTSANRQVKRDTAPRDLHVLRRHILCVCGMCLTEAVGIHSGPSLGAIQVTIEGLSFIFYWVEKWEGTKKDS